MRAASRPSVVLSVACAVAFAAADLAAQQFQPASQPLPGAAPQPLPNASWQPQPIYLQPAAQVAPGQGAAELETVAKARQTLDEFAKLTIDSIPPAMLNNAEGIAIFPGMVKGGFILGVNFGRGVLLVRKADRTWSAPVMATMGGGSIGFQAGVQSADIVLVFATPKSLQGILTGQKVTLGADAALAVGPVGRQANAGTDARLGAEIYSYARSRGLFAGVSVGGADLSIDANANSVLYGRLGVTPADVFNGTNLTMRPEVQQLVDDLDARTRQQPAMPPAAQPLPASVPQQVPAQAPQPVPVAAPPVQPQQPAAAAPPIVPIR
ncbi:MAG: lipid-binding SYLF domain-containing protein [Planctomycetia bacterium]|jgi:lipid-binding SYLF domain-containing protein